MTYILNKDHLLLKNNSHIFCNFQALKVLHNSSEFLPFVIYLFHPSPAVAKASKRSKASTSDNDVNGIEEIAVVENGKAPSEEIQLNHLVRIATIWAVGVVKRSVFCLRLWRSNSNRASFFCKIWVWKDENEQKEAGVDSFLRLQSLEYNFIGT